MINRGQCFVRALNEDDKFDSIDVLDLDDESFRRWIISVLALERLVTYIHNEELEKEPLRARKQIR